MCCGGEKADLAGQPGPVRGRSVPPAQAVHRGEGSGALQQRRLRPAQLLQPVSKDAAPGGGEPRRLSRSAPLAWRLHLWYDAAAVAGGPEADPDDWEEREALRHGAAVFKDAVPANAERALLHAEGGAAHVSSRSGHH